MSAGAKVARNVECASIGGIPLELLAARAGGTPFFAYDRALLSQRVELLRSVLPAGIELSYALKANPMPALVQHLSRLVDDFDVASVAEMRVALDTEVPANRVSFAGPGKTVQELTQAIAAGVTIQLESQLEAERASVIGAELGVRPRVAIRINPDYQMKGSGMRMGGGAQQFGIDSERVPALLGRITEMGLEMIGFHIFAGSQNLDAEVISESQRRAVDLMLQLAEQTSSEISYMNLGGGFGIPYFEQDRPLDLAAVGSNLGELLAERVHPVLPDARVVIELGRYIAGECGFYVTRVVDRKESRGKTFLVVDGGLHHQLAASGNLGQVIRRDYPISIGGRSADEITETVTIVGCLCTPLDLMADGAALPRADVGDLVVMFYAGAYGLTASPSAFLSHAQPVELLV